MAWFSDLRSELSTLFSRSSTRILDSVSPLLVFYVLQIAVGLSTAFWASIIVAGVIAFFRAITGRSLVYALGGLGGVLLAFAVSRLTGSDAGFFLPGILSGSSIVAICVLSVVANRPLVAWTSYIARRWPRDWYWHPKVLPAYNEVTILWAVAYGARLALELFLFGDGALDALSAVRVISGWPYTILLLVISYSYGIWRLSHLQGPSTAEFISGAAPPWQGQKKGF